LRPTSFFSCSSQIITKASPPSAVLIGSVTVRTAAVATAASMALPPFLRMSRPALAANGWLVATTPRWPITGDRLVSNWNPSSSRGRCGPRPWKAEPAVAASSETSIRPETTIVDRLQDMCFPPSDGVVGRFSSWRR
jgi:hypothetical protein